MGVSEPHLVGEQLLEPEVDFYGMSLQDGDFVEVPYPGGRVMEDGAFVTGHAGRVDIESAAHTHTAAMTAQVWDGEPPADESRTWDLTAQEHVFSGTGVLQVWGVTCGPIPDEIDLGKPNRDWWVRVYSAGREEAARVVDEEGVAEGVEVYLVQFWPRH